MPQFIVTSPDGKRFRINAPEGSTQEQALAYAKQQFATQKPDLKASNPAEYDPASPEYQAKYGATSGMTWGDKFSAGVGKSFVDTARGVGQLLGVVDQSTVDEAAARDKALMDTGAGTVGNIAGQVAQFAVPGGYIARGGGLAARVARGAAFGAGIANTQPVTSGQTRLGNTALGAAGGAAGEAAAAGLGRVAAGASDKIAPEVRKLAQRARELGIPLRVEQVTQSRALQGVSAGLEMVPFSGREAARNTQRAAWNRALSRTVGQNDTNLRTAIDKAEDTLSARYNAALSNPVKADDSLTSGIQRVLKEAEAELDPQQFARLQKQAENLLGKAADGVIDGRAVYNTKKILDRLAKSQDSSLKYHAQELRGELFGALDRSLPDAKAFAKVREQYGNLITLRRALRAGAEGTVTPAKLASMQTRGALKELADIGATFLVEPFGNSGTANRIFGSVAVGGSIPAAFVDPTALAIGAGTVATARGTNALLGAQPIVNYATQGSNALMRLTPPANRLLPTLGAVASQ